MNNLVMIPALGCDERLYRDLLAELPDTLRPVTLIADADRLDACVEQILERAPGRFVLIGTSFGGRVALETALAAPERVTGLVVIGASAGPTPDRAAGIRRSDRLRGSEFEAVITEMADRISHLAGPGGPRTREAFLAMARRQGGDLMARQSDALAWRSDLRPRLEDLACPVLALWGAEDRFVSAAEGLALATALPRARFVRIEACGHFPTLEAPAEAAAAIRHWLADYGLA